MRRLFIAAAALALMSAAPAVAQIGATAIPGGRARRERASAQAWAEG